MTKTVREIREALEDYGDHLEVVGVNDNGTAYPIFTVSQTTIHGGEPAVALELDDEEV